MLCLQFIPCCSLVCLSTTIIHMSLVICLHIFSTFTLDSPSSSYIPAICCPFLHDDAITCHHACHLHSHHYHACLHTHVTAYYSDGYTPAVYPSFDAPFPILRYSGTCADHTYYTGGGAAPSGRRKEEYRRRYVLTIYLPGGRILFI